MLNKTRVVKNVDLNHQMRTSERLRRLLVLNFGRSDGHVSRVRLFISK